MIDCDFMLSERFLCIFLNLCILTWNIPQIFYKPVFGWCRPLLFTFSLCILLQKSSASIELEHGISVTAGEHVYLLSSLFNNRTIILPGLNELSIIHVTSMADEKSECFSPVRQCVVHTN